MMRGRIRGEVGRITVFMLIGRSLGFGFRLFRPKLGRNCSSSTFISRRIVGSVELDRMLDQVGFR